MTELTERQAQVLTAIANSLEENGFPPTIPELCEQFGFASTNGMAEHLQALERKGYISRQPMKARAIRLTDAGRAAVRA